MSSDYDSDLPESQELNRQKDIPESDESMYKGPEVGRSLVGLREKRECGVRMHQIQVSQLGNDGSQERA